MATVFFVNGATLSSWTPRLPELQRELGISDAALGVTLVGMGLGGLATSSMSGWLVDRRGSRTTTLATSAAMSLWLPILGFAPTALLVFAALLVLGALDGLTDVAMNSQAVELQRRTSPLDPDPCARGVVGGRGRRRAGRESRCGVRCLVAGATRDQDGCLLHAQDRLRGS